MIDISWMSKHVLKLTPSPILSPAPLFTGSLTL